MRANFLAIIVVLISFSANAIDAKGEYATLGYGAQSCGDYVQASHKDKLFYDTWLTGYLTNFNAITPSTYDILQDSDIGGVTVWIKNYCTTNPLDSFADAASALILELKNKHD